MTQIQIDPGLQQKLGGMAEPVAFCDPFGKVLGHFLPEVEYKRLLYASFNLPLSDEEIERRLAETGGCTLDEIWKKLGRE
jgi:hypothetical protein